MFFIVAGFSVRGRPWAVGITVAVGSVLAALLTYAAAYFVCALFARLVGAETIVVKTSRGALIREGAAGSQPLAGESDANATEEPRP